MMKKILILCCFLAFSTGCSEALKDFLRSDEVVEDDPSSGVENPTLGGGKAVSPGRMHAQGASMSGTFNTLHRSHRVNNGTMSATVTINGGQ